MFSSYDTISRPFSSSALGHDKSDSSAEELSEFKADSASADSGRGMLTSADEGGEDDLQLKPPSSHESPSLLYDPQARLKSSALSCPVYTY